MKTLDDYNFKNKRALIRVDFNVPLNEDLQPTDDTRIRSAKPSIEKVLNDGGSVVLMSHLGRPKGVETKYSLKNIVKSIEAILGTTVIFGGDCIGEKALKLSKDLKPGAVLLLENLRFHPEEKEGDAAFAKKLAEQGDIYVNDAFGTAHRAHASTAVIAKFFREKCAGELLKREIQNSNKVMNSSEKPVTAILGGAKVSSKITVIENILDKVDTMIIGGGMSFTFIKAEGGKVGDSMVEPQYETMAIDILKKAKEKNVQIVLPVDAEVTEGFFNDGPHHTEDIAQISSPWMGLDIGSESQKLFADVILKAKVVLWNGPMGVFEFDNFAAGTRAVGQAVAEATEKGAFSLVGGGDSVAAAKKFGLQNQVSYISTGGGAILEMLEGKTLPGIAALAE